MEGITILSFPINSRNNYYVKFTSSVSNPVYIFRTYYELENIKYGQDQDPLNDPIIYEDNTFQINSVNKLLSKLPPNTDCLFKIFTIDPDAIFEVLQI